MFGLALIRRMNILLITPCLLSIIFLEWRHCGTRQESTPSAATSSLKHPFRNLDQHALCQDTRTDSAKLLQMLLRHHRKTCSDKCEQQNIFYELSRHETGKNRLKTVIDTYHIIELPIHRGQRDFVSLSLRRCASACLTARFNWVEVAVCHVTQNIISFK